jgi:hypothetical protein
MFDDVLHITEAFNAFFARLHGAVRDDFFKGFEILVSAAALTAIGAAFARRMIPLRTMSILNNMFGVAAGIGSGSLLSNTP